MANKRYDQFDAAAPTTDRLILHADDTTGELKKTTIGDVLSLGSGGGLSITHYNNALNTGSNPQTMLTLTIPANSITTFPCYAEINVLFDFLTSSGSKTVTLVLAGQTIVTDNATAQQQHKFLCNLCFISSASVSRTVYVSRGAASNTLSGVGTTIVDTTADIVIDVIVTAGIANDIRSYYATFNATSP